MGMDISAKRRILVISSDPALEALLGHNLGERGYRVAKWRGSGEGLEAVLGEVRPALVLLDIQMPLLDGIEMCLRIRQCSAVPIIMLSTWGAGKDRVRGLDLSADSYLTEPFDIEQLLARIEDTLPNSCDSGELLSSVSLRGLAQEQGWPTTQDWRRRCVESRVSNKYQGGR